MNIWQNQNQKNHVAPRYGTGEEASGCCGKGDEEKTKEGWASFYENPSSTAKTYQRGQLNQNGARHDLDQAKQDVLHGKRVDDIVIESPMMYHIIMSGRTLRDNEKIKNRKVRSRWKIVGK